MAPSRMYSSFGSTHLVISAMPSQLSWSSANSASISLLHLHGSEENCRLSFSRISSLSGSNDRRSEEHTSELQSRQYLVCRLLLEKKKDMSIVPSGVTTQVTRSTAGASLASLGSSL